MKWVSIFGQRIVDDFKHKELLPVKVLFFVHMSTILVLYPYLTIHMRELGINVEETAVMSALTPVVGIIMPPMAGLLADKIGNFKVMLALFSVFSGLSALLLLLVPIGRVTITYPDELVLGLSCEGGSAPIFTMYQEHPCENSNDTLEADAIVRSCGFLCQANVDVGDTEAILRARYYDVKMYNVLDNRTVSLRYELSPSDYYVPRVIGEATNHEQLLNNERYTTAIRRLANNSFYFPTKSLNNFSCQLGYNNSNNYGCSLKDFSNDWSSFKVGLSKQAILENVRLYTAIYFKDSYNNKHNATCASHAENDEYSIEVSLEDDNTTDTLQELKLERCSAQCVATTPREKFCSNKNTLVDLNISLTFWTYLLVRVFIGIIGGTAYTMFEGAVIAILREYKADYGLQRMYASIGGMISSPLSGLLIDYASRGKSYTDFRPIFFLYAGLKVTSAVLMLFINLEFKRPAQSVVADVMSVINVELISLFVAAFLLGSAWGYIESFLFWLLQDLGGTKSLMGLTITVGGVLGIPLLALSGPITQKVGHANLIFIGFLTYAVRLFGYSIIYNPWLSLIFESMECLTHSLCFTAAITYAAKLSSVTTDTTIQGILGGLFYGVGKSAGSLVGGYLIKYVGMRGTFQIFSAVTACTAFVYLGFYHIYMKKHSTLTDEPEIDDAVENGTKPSSKEKECDQLDMTTKSQYINSGYTVTEEDTKPQAAVPKQHAA